MKNISKICFLLRKKLEKKNPIIIIFYFKVKKKKDEYINPMLRIDDWFPWHIIIIFILVLNLKCGFLK